MQFTIEIQASQYAAMLQAALRAVNNPQKLLLSWGESLYRVNTMRHAQGLAPDGSKWKPLSPLTIGSKVWQAQRPSYRKSGTMSLATAMKVKSKGILRQHGDMLGSFNYQVDNGALTLGFSDHKAVWHHHGTGTYGPKGASYTIAPVKAKALSFAGLVRKRVTHPGIPKRELVGFPPSNQRLVVQVTRDYLNAAIKGG